MTDNKESLSGFVENSEQKLAREFDALLGSNVLVSPTEEQYDLLLKGLRQQLGEGRGEVILEVKLLQLNVLPIFIFSNIFLTHLYFLKSLVSLETLSYV